MNILSFVHYLGHSNESHKNEEKILYLIFRTIRKSIETSNTMQLIDINIKYFMIYNSFDLSQAIVKKNGTDFSPTRSRR